MTLRPKFLTAFFYKLNLSFTLLELGFFKGIDLVVSVQQLGPECPMSLVLGLQNKIKESCYQLNYSLIKQMRHLSKYKSIWGNERSMESDLRDFTEQQHLNLIWKRSEI